MLREFDHVAPPLVGYRDAAVAGERHPVAVGGNPHVVQVGMDAERREVELFAAVVGCREQHAHAVYGR